jgi:hypothetical protein
MIYRDLYFARPIAGTMTTRYFIGHFTAHRVFHVTRTQVSRPDGQQIDAPVRIVMPQPPAPSAPAGGITRLCIACDTRKPAAQFLMGKNSCLACRRAYERRFKQPRDRHRPRENEQEISE